jgi:hypothetical protein
LEMLQLDCSSNLELFAMLLYPWAIMLAKAFNRIFFIMLKFLQHLLNMIW